VHVELRTGVGTGFPQAVCSAKALDVCLGEAIRLEQQRAGRKRAVSQRESQFHCSFLSFDFWCWHRSINAS
jgi:hypothetical protein